MSLRQSLRALCVLAVLAAGLGADEPITLRYKAKPGDQLVYRNQNSIEQVQKIGEVKLENKLSQEEQVRRTFAEPTQEGTLQYTAKTERLKVQHKLGPLGEYKFDSQATERETGSMLGDALTPLYERLSGGELQITLTPRGDVKQVKGLTEMIGDLLKNNPIASQFAGGGSDKAALVGVQQHTLRFQEGPVSPGEMWEHPIEVELPGLGTGKGKTIYTFTGTKEVDGRKIAEISLNQSLSFDVSLETMGAKVTGTVSTGNFSGKAEFDLEAGRLLSMKIEQTLSGRLSVDVAGQTINIDQEQTQTDSVELLPAEQK
jgi:hypothetical protein